VVNCNSSLNLQVRCFVTNLFTYWIFLSRFVNVFKWLKRSWFFCLWACKILLLKIWFLHFCSQFTYIHYAWKRLASILAFRNARFVIGVVFFFNQLNWLQLKLSSHFGALKILCFVWILSLSNNNRKVFLCCFNLSRVIFQN